MKNCLRACSLTGRRPPINYSTPKSWVRVWGAFSPERGRRGGEFPCFPARARRKCENQKERGNTPEPKSYDFCRPSLLFKAKIMGQAVIK